jgi:hypothetical protein
MLILGCWHSTTEGCSRVERLCPPCKFREQRPGDTSPPGAGEEPPKYLLATQQQSDDGLIKAMTIHGVPETNRIWLQRRLGISDADEVLAEKFWKEKTTPGEKEVGNEKQREALPSVRRQDSQDEQ